ncbi:MAG: hypothetical protein AABY22_20440 [Nanoarchaeota archaeon]
MKINWDEFIRLFCSTVLFIAVLILFGLAICNGPHGPKRPSGANSYNPNFFRH